MSAIEIPDLLRRFLITTLTFEDLASLDGEELGLANNPYAVIGLTISRAIVKADANLNSSSRGVALKSGRLPDETSQDEIELRFSKPQGGFGFFYRTPGATLLTVKALDSDETVLEEDVFQDGEGYSGIIRARAEIGIVRILAKTNAGDSTGNTSFYIDDLAFGRELKAGY
jgi:hypothetical protein